MIDAADVYNITIYNSQWQEYKFVKKSNYWLLVLLISDIFQLSNFDMLLIFCHDENAQKVDALGKVAVLCMDQILEVCI